MRQQRYRYIILMCAFGFFWSTTVLGRRPASLTGMGPFKVLLRKFTNVSDDNTSSGKIWSQLFFSSYKDRQLQNVWGISYSTIDISDDLKAEVRLASRVNHKWKKTSFAINMEHACSEIMHHSKQVPLMFFGDQADRCPIKAGQRQITNHTVDLVFPEFRTFAYARWLFTLALKKGSEVVGLYVVDCETVPRN